MKSKNIAGLMLVASALSFADIVYTDPDGILPINFLPTRVGTSNTLLIPVTTLARRTGATTNPVTASFSDPSLPNFSRVGTQTFTQNIVLSALPILTTPVSRNYQFAPSARGAQTATATVGFAGASVASRSFNLNGRGIGPVYNDVNYNPGGTINFGTVVTNTTASTPFGLGNSTPDATLLSLLVSDPRLRLTITGFSITGGAGAFSSNILPGQTYNPGTQSFFDIFFSPTTDGAYNAVLNVFTDENAALGGAGSSFSYNLVGTAVPEPSTVVLTGVAALAALALRRRRAAR